ncbi:MAG: 50S ribosomal protein L37e [Candidatus Bathyarchaeota archaeon]|nr:MAG: 50S ribosomal protein L37e [Candidatus Bathyarchaeota archaeon]
MTKGTASLGKKHKTRVINCRRCGRRSYHIRKKKCSACGFGRSSKIRRYSWQTKVFTRSMRIV